MRITKKNILTALYCKAFKQGEDPDIIGVIYSYKMLDNISDELQEALYNYLADELGLTNTEQTTKEQKILIDNFINS